ncbi:NAD-dependent epimerase/dehydratase family protein [Mariniblastus fucicola]|uniref:3 beta-hydroxysteroid dehydrogenase/Delta 5-->4-isomerase n=1 Tax=Mariniblastus fucicola TaxID=980251 RepID=A0A5B9P9K0_9BACT|nr:NAD-dependent epimerase/dehydratase family protein [Mariniblastus fucicola]QEG22998.1 3 beta-hydroxysteroid dehydrogenase/Delta 5-->4-isomerase [Mariniblastus fucicola]
MKALVTGANGFLGSYLVRELLASGYEVTAMTRRRDDAGSLQDVRHVNGDVRNAESVEEACRGQEVVFHVAAISGIWGPWKLYHSTNTIGTRNVVESCLNQEVKKLVYTSSPSVTFGGKHQIDQNESAPYPRDWLAHYPHSKALAEQCVLDANDDKQLMTCALRPHLIWGPGDRHLIPRLIERAREGQLRRVGDGKNLVDSIFVENAALAHVQAAEAMRPGSPVCGSAYFLSQDEPVNLWAWINEILELGRVPKVTKSISYPWAWRLGYMLEAWHSIRELPGEPRMTRFLAAQLAKSHYFDISRAKEDFGYHPRVSMAEGMRRLGETLGAGDVDREVG